MSQKHSPIWRRIVAAFMVGTAIAFSAYVLIDITRNINGFSSIWFLAVLPAFLSALICYIADADRTRSSGFYIAVPVILVITVGIGSIVFWQEGVICLIMLAPVWIGFGWIGAFVIYRLRKRRNDPTTLHATLLFLPLLAGVIEDRLTFPHETYTVTREVVINASADEIWPYAVANAHISPSEGHWTFTQNIAGLARPRATVMTSSGVGAVRTAYWGEHISFDEVITDWKPGQRLAWDFDFKNTSLQDYSDKHISPDGPVLKIDSGEYRLERLSPTTTRLTLQTQYVAKSHVNLYAALWGEVFLGDVQSNVLSIIKDRAES